MLASDQNGRGHDMRWPYYCRVPVQCFPQLGLACDKSPFLESVPVQLSQHSGDTRFSAVIRLHESHRPALDLLEASHIFLEVRVPDRGCVLSDLTRTLYAVSFSDFGYESIRGDKEEGIIWPTTE